MVSPFGNTGCIALDAMGGDLGPSEIVAATQLALAERADLLPITLVGDQPVLDALLGEAKLTGHPKLSVLHASEVVTMDDKPLQAFRRKKDSSMARAIDLVKSGGASALVSCGNTGALMAGGTIRLRTLTGIERPALAAIIPRENGYFILIDAGANPQSEAIHLLHNALLGSHYAKVILDVKQPRVGLLTIGTEEGKGNSLVADTHALLKQNTGLLNYVGLTEGFQIFSDHCDVAVCDGFVGNLLLKGWESLLKFFSGTLKQELRATPLRAIGALLSKGAFASVKERLNPDIYGGAPLLGLKGNILKAHGSSNRQAVKNAIFAANKVVRADLLNLIETDTAKLLAAPASPPVAETVQS